jgi:hypothetical protein
VSVVSEIIPQERVVVTVDINDNPSALDVSKLMAKHRIGSIVVIEVTIRSRLALSLKGIS